MVHFIAKIVSPTFQIKKAYQKGIVHIRTTYNNTLITIRSNFGKVIAWSSSGICGFRGARKRTPFAAKTVAENAAKKTMKHGIQKVRVYLFGPGFGREIAIRRICEGFHVKIIRDVTALPHNGCRSPKRRRVLIKWF
uniref:Small ribosomal subunit protein uS11c n=1 Tax=Lepidodinium chlorophorum TaxID=107758 RepID=A0A0F7R552_LEPCH|nr:ribosomal protein S11 [Lepidodinium chlorophorum]BAR72304.1 ribosomal protein S11 [Lepidodinium chlorophorum]